ncbi:hypothetical protein OROGR_028478 [Orobanche gracilis]
MPKWSLQYWFPADYSSGNEIHLLWQLTTNFFDPVDPEGGIGLGAMLDGEGLLQHNQDQHILH